MAREGGRPFGTYPALCLRPPELGDLPGYFLKGFSTLLGEAEGDVRLIYLVEVLLRFSDFRAPRAPGGREARTSRAAPSGWSSPSVRSAFRRRVLFPPVP